MVSDATLLKPEGGFTVGWRFVPWMLFCSVLAAAYAVLQWAPAVTLATPIGLVIAWIAGFFAWLLALLVVGIVVRNDRDARLLVLGAALLLTPVGPATAQVVGALNARWDQRPGELYLVPCRDVSRNRSELRLELSPRTPTGASLVLDATPWREQLGPTPSSVLLLVRPGAFGLEWVVWVRDVRRVNHRGESPRR